MGEKEAPEGAGGWGYPFLGFPLRQATVQFDLPPITIVLHWEVIFCNGPGNRGQRGSEELLVVLPPCPQRVPLED